MSASGDGQKPEGQDAEPNDVENGTRFAPRFGGDGLLPVVTTDARTGEVLMLAYMNEQALRRTIETGEAHYWSRSRAKLWRKGEESGNTQRVVEMRTDCDQDAIWLSVEMGGADACCHTGRRSCFYRIVPSGESSGDHELRFAGAEKRFDPNVLYARGRALKEP